MVGPGRRVLLLLAVFAFVACSPAANSAAKPSPSAPTVLAGSIGSAAYSIEVPASWNGTLFLFSHGYTEPGNPNPAVAAPSPETSSWLLAHHYAIAGSSYSSTGWALEDGFKDQIALLDLFDQRIAKPARVIAWGYSLGGIITAGLVQLHPDRIAGALPMCGVLSGAVASWNAGLDHAYAFRTNSALHLTHISDPAANFQLARDIFDKARTTPAGYVRLALAAALAGEPTWYDSTKPRPAPTDLKARMTAQESLESRIGFALEFAFRAELEKRAGGNPSWNTRVNYHRQLSISQDAADVTALYDAAGLNLEADLRKLEAGARVAADPAAVAYLERNLSFDGRLSVPVLTLHTTNDGLVIPQNESAYAAVVSGAGKQDLLRQTFVNRVGHCAFTPAETIALAQVMIKRLDTGRWDDEALQPAALDVAALALGQSDSSLTSVPFQPAFVDFKPGAHPRHSRRAREPPARQLPPRSKSLRTRCRRFL